MRSAVNEPEAGGSTEMLAVGTRVRFHYGKVTRCGVIEDIGKRAYTIEVQWMRGSTRYLIDHDQVIDTLP